MKIVSLKKGKKNTYIVSFKEKEYLFYDDIIVRYGLIPKKEIDEKELLEIESENNKLESYYQALQYLNIRMRSKKELQKYLEKKSYSKEIIQETLERLIKEGYLNEIHYIESYINDSFRFSNDGPLNIKKKLVDLGISESIILEKLENISKEEWIEKLQKIFHKKASSKHKESIKKWQQKCEIYCYNLGYPKSYVEEIANQYLWVEESGLIDSELEKLERKWSRKYQNEELEFQLKRKLYEKGFEKDQITEALEKRKNKK